MDKREIVEIQRIVGEDHVFPDEPMSRHTTFRIGGPADLMVCPQSGEATTEILRYCREQGIPWFIIGNGSDLLVSDDGYRGVIVQIDQNLQRVHTEGCVIRAEAGILLSRLAAEARDHSLTGFEFASGIPGTLGGACTMNAGAYGGEMKHVLKSVTVLDENLEVRTVAVEDLDLGYRHSRIMDRRWIVLEAEVLLEKGEKEKITVRMNELRDARVSKQPLEYPSAGSTFKRPEGYYAGKLIMDAGLCGFRVGGAQVSEKHCGFVINRDHATAEDVRELISEVQKRVFDKFQVHLEPEVRFLGFHD
ncbi:MAG: UDP-N-acetylmuramate dehydrogenase [Bilifractor sp.]|nr:UDP-N-acetylmuramate dehydrogenase [Lachnospiraceae bacterium]MDY2837743.1 UDP-N-acetylmuramate dehydrogenase [Bilifractor sp.]